MALFGLGSDSRTVGLDIGSGVVKVAVVDHEKDQPQLERVGLRPLAGSAIVDGEIVDPGLVAETVRDLFAELGIETDEVVTSVGGRDVIVKLIQMDRMSESDARGVIRWEAEQHVPFDMENVELDFQITDPAGEGMQMSVLLVAAKRELVENKIALVEDAGLTPTIVDVDAFALHNALEVNHPEAMNGTTGLVSIGHESTTVNIIQDGIPVLTRDLTFGTRRLTQDLQRERGLTAEEAESVLRGDRADPMLPSFLEERAREVGRGVERASAFLDSTSVGQGMGQLFVCGGGVGVPGLAESIGEDLGIGTRVAGAFDGLQIKAEAVDDQDLDEIASLLLLATGLALRKTS